jgi:glucose-1-phosphate thymidylyltransferase
VTTWGIIPAAGTGSRIQPLAFSKELLPVGSRKEGEVERPKAVSEYLVERMVLGGATKICFVIARDKSDILEYYGGGDCSAELAFVVQPRPAGLCDAIFRALPLLNSEDQVLVGLPDTIWFPEGALRLLSDDELSFLLFSVETPELFDAVVTRPDGSVVRIDVKSRRAETPWIWGAFKLPVRTLIQLFDLFCRRGRSDPYFGTLVNAYIEEGGRARAVSAGEAYVDVGTVHGYRQALKLLQGRP